MRVPPSSVIHGGPVGRGDRRPPAAAGISDDVSYPVQAAELASALGRRRRRWTPPFDLPPPLVVFGAAAYVIAEMTSVHAFRRMLLALPFVAVLLASAHLRRYPGSSRRVMPLALVGFLIWVALSYGWSVDTHDSAHQVLEYLAVAATGVVLAVALDQESLLRAFSLGSKVFVVMTGVALVVAYHSASTPPAIDPAPGWHGPLGGKNGLGFLMAIALITFTCQRSTRRCSRWWFVGAAVLLLGSQSGAGLCVALVGLAVVVWGRALSGMRRVSSRLGFKVVSLALAACGAVLLITDLPAATALLGKNSTLTGRTKIWSAVVDAIGHNLVHGYGFAAVWLNKTGETAALWHKIGFQVYEAHDVYLDVLLQLGVVGLVLLVLAVVGAWRWMLPALFHGPATTRWLNLIVIALLVEGVVESDLLGNDVILLTATLAAAVQLRRPPAARGVTDEPLLWRGPPPSSGARPNRRSRYAAAVRDKVRSAGKDLVKDLQWGTAFEIASLAGSVVTFVVLARVLGPVAFGYYAAVTGVVGILGTVVNNWVGFVILENSLRDGQDVQTAASSLTTWVCIGAALAIVLAVSLGHVVLPYVSLTVSLSFVAAAVIGNSAVVVSSAVVQAVRGFAVSARGRVALQVLLLVVVIALWQGGHLTLLTLAVGTLAVNVGVGAWYVMSAWKTCRIRIAPGRAYLADLRRGSLYGAVLLFFAVEEDLDKPLLVGLGFRRVAGPYAAAYNIVSMGFLPLNAATASTHNRFLVHSPSALGEHLRRSVRFTLPAAVYGVVAVAVVELCAPLVPLVLGSAYQSTTLMIRLLAFLILFRSLTVFAFNGLMGLGKGAWRTVVLGVSAALNVALNVALIPLMSWRGAVVATLGGEAAYLSLTWIGLLRFQRDHDREVLARSPKTTDVLVAGED